MRWEWIYRNLFGTQNTSCCIAVPRANGAGLAKVRFVDAICRSGSKLLYLPLNDITCCPLKPIRLRVSAFTPSRSQRKAYRRIATRFRLLTTYSQGDITKDLEAYPEAIKDMYKVENFKETKEMGVLPAFTVRLLEPSELLAEFELASLFTLFLKYQQAVHEDAATWTVDSFKSFIIDGALEVWAL